MELLELISEWSSEHLTVEDLNHKLLSKFFWDSFIVI